MRLQPSARDHTMSTSKAAESLTVASSLVSEEQYGRAFAHYLLALALDPSIKERKDVEESFVDCLESWSSQLVSLQREKDAAWCFEQACDVWPESGSVLHAMGRFLFQSGFRGEGLSFLKKACCMGSKVPRPDWLWDLQNAASSLVDRWHFRMLNDRSRNQAYYDALERAVRTGHHRILDIGSGTGILSMLAVRAGASDVTACEMDPVMSDLSERIIKKNGMKNRIVVENMKSTEMNIDASTYDRFTLVVTEIADAGLLGEGIIPTLQHAWTHLLQPRNDASQHALPSQVIPAGATVYVQLIGGTYIRRRHGLQRDGPDIDSWSMPVVRSRCTPVTFDSNNTCDEGETEPYTSENLSQVPGGWRPLSAPLQVYQFNFCGAEILGVDHLREETISIPVIDSGHADAVVSWFELHLDSQSTVSSSPDSGSCWEQAVYPINADLHDCDMKVDPDDLVDVSCRCYPTWMSFSVKAVRRKVEGHEGTSDLSGDQNAGTQQRNPAFSSSNNSGNNCPKDARNEADREVSGLNHSSSQLDRHKEDMDTRHTTDGIYKHKEADFECSAPREDHSTLRTLSISSRDLALLNDSRYREFIRASLGHYAQKTSVPSKHEQADRKETESNDTILDMTGVGLVSLLGHKSIRPGGHVVHVISDEDRKLFLDEFFRRNEERLSNYRHITESDFRDGCMANDVRIVVSDLVDSNGTLKELTLEDISLACGRNPLVNVRVIPEVLRVHAICIESEELRRDTRITGTEPTLGLDVTLINEYKTSTQLDFCLSKLPHRRLTEPFVVFNFNLAQLGRSKNPLETFLQETESLVKVTDTGSISSVVYWFEMSSGSGDVISTLEEDTHWLQAAFMLDEDLAVKKGDEIRILSYIRNNALSFAVI